MAGDSLELTGGQGFDRMLAKAQALATGRVSRVLMPRIAGGEVKRLALAARASQTAPTGKKWPKTKNGQALKWPGEATVKVSIVNGKIVAKVSGPAYLAPQHSGWRKMMLKMPRARNADGKRVQASGPPRIRRWSGKARRVLPKGAVPKAWANILTKVMNAGWRSFMGSTSLARAKK